MSHVCDAGILYGKNSVGGDMGVGRSTVASTGRRSVQCPTDLGGPHAMCVYTFRPR
jgi:hypothetical protein